MKKVLLILAVIGLMFAPSSSFAHGWRGCHGGWHHGWHGGRHHYYGGYGRGFWPGFACGVVGGLVGGALARPYYYGSYYPNTVVVQRPAPVIVQQPTVVQQPVVVQQSVVQAPQPQQVWVPGMYVDQVQANGSTIRVWQPGHYEYR